MPIVVGGGTEEPQELLKRAMVCVKERHIAALIGKNLQRENYTVVFAESHAEAIARMKPAPIDLLIIEDEFSEPSISEVIKALRADPRNENPKVYVFDRSSSNPDGPFTLD